MCSQTGMVDDAPFRTDIEVPAGRDRLGRTHQLVVEVSISISMAPAWLRRAIGDKHPMAARAARVELAERIAAAIERRFAVAWRGATDPGENARPADSSGPLFGGPERDESAIGRVDDEPRREQNKNDSSI